ncbi:MAG: hypothetical protein FIB01_16400 [Gemmatimonadetes bacterium]|nr:hypothetical protein [Gemmatimonadota bacterium]
MVNGEGDVDRTSITYNRPDFRATSSNEFLGFVQYIRSLLEVHGRAAHLRLNSLWRHTPWPPSFPA